MALKDDKIKMTMELDASQLQEEYHKSEKALVSYLARQKELGKGLKEAIKKYGENSNEAKKLRNEYNAVGREITACNKRMSDLLSQMEKSDMTTDQLKRRQHELKEEFRSCSRAVDPKRYDELQQELKEIGNAAKQAKGEIQETNKGFTALTAVSGVVSGALAKVGHLLIDSIVSAFKNASNTIMDFERANSKLAAVLGTKLEGIDSLTDQAKELGRTTTATASEVTGLQIELAKLGFTQQQIENLTPATLKFAKAVDTDLSSAAAFAGAAMRMFNKDASEAESVLATFAISTTRSALDFNKLQSSLATIGPVANAFGLSLEDTTALLGQLANAGFDASSAATATRNILLNLADSNGQLAQALGGPVTSLDDMVNGMRKLNEEGVDLAKALELTDKRSVAAFTTFLNGADDMLTLRDAITDCKDDFKEMGATMTDNAAGSWAGFQSAIEGLVLVFFDFRKVLQEVYSVATSFVQNLAGFLEYFKPVATIIGTTVGALAYLVKGLITGLNIVIKWVGQLTPIKVGLNALVTGFIALRIQVALTSKGFKDGAVAIWNKVAALVGLRNSTEQATIKQRLLNIAQKSSPVMWLISGVMALATAIFTYKKSAEDAVDAQKELNEIEQIAANRSDAHAKSKGELNKNIAEEKNKIKELLKVAENENLSKERRQKAINELNRICPEYKGHIDAETGALRGARIELDKYLLSLEKRAKLEYYKDNYTQYIKDIEDATRKTQRFYDTNLKREVERRANVLRTRQTWEDDSTMMQAAYGSLVDDYYAGRLKGSLNDATKEFIASESAIHVLNAELSELKVDMRDAGIQIEDVLTETETATQNVVNGADKELNRLKQINSELKNLRKQMKSADDEEAREIQAKIDRLTKERKTLMGKSTEKQTGQYAAESLKEIESPIKREHTQKQTEIDAQKGNMSAFDYQKQSAGEAMRYYTELIAAYNDFLQEIPKNHTQTIDKVNEAIAATNAELVKADAQMSMALMEEEQQGFDDRLEAVDAYYTNLNQTMRQKAQQGIADQEAVNIFLLGAERNLAADRLKILQEQLAAAEAAEGICAEERMKITQRLTKEVQKEQNNLLTATGKYAEKMREMSTDTTSIEGVLGGIRERYAATEEQYDAMIALAKKNGDDTVALEQEKNRRLLAISAEYDEQIWKIKEAAGLSWSQEYDRELQALKNMHKQGLISEEAFQKQKMKLGVDNAKKYFDYYSGAASSMFTALQDAEIATSDAKYDVLIQQAKNNGEDTAALEEEKQNKQLEIQKKYADVNFAIKISEIIANTAVAIMTAFSQLGPIGGAIAAAMLTATGVAQVISAKAERDKVKKMQPSHTAVTSSSQGTTQNYSRQLTGYSEGGYTGPGGRYEVAGVVHRGEYVVPMPIMGDPRVIDAVGTIEAIRQHKRRSQGTVPSSSSGFAEGGYTSEQLPAKIAIDTSGLETATRELRAAAANIRAYVLLNDIRKAENTLAQAQKTFSK